MDVWVMHERLSPRVQHAQKADLGTQALRVGCDLQQRVGHAAEQQVVEGALVLQHEFGELVRYGEHDVEVVQRDQFAGPRRHPAVACLRLALGTVAIAAGVEGKAEILSALRAAVAVATERGRTAALDGSHDFMLRPGDASPATFDKAEGVCAEDVSYLQHGQAHDSAGSWLVRLDGGRVSRGFGAERNFRVAK